MKEENNKHMTEETTVRVERKDRIGYITLARPDKLNAVTKQLKSDFEAALDQHLEDSEVRVIVIRGEGRAFCAGYDLNPGENMETKSSGTRTLGDDLVWVQGESRTWSRLWHCAKPTIAQVHGYCLAGGLMIALECDLVVAAHDAQFGQPEARAVGIAPDHALWPITAGLRQTKELLFTSRSISGREAAQMGMINRSVDPSGLESEVFALATEIAKTSSEMLTLQKASVNNAAEAMGISGVRSAGAIFDVVAHASKTARHWRKVVREKGVKAGMALLTDGE